MSDILIGDNLPCYLARPKREIKCGVLVIQEVWGLTNHIKDVADRLANEGYLALAPDLFFDSELDMEKMSGLQNSLFDPKLRNEAQPKLRELMSPMNDPNFGRDMLAKLSSSFDYLYDLPEVKQKVAVIGFCFGGSYSFALAEQEPRAKLAMPFYGHASTDVEYLKKIGCPVRAFYGHNDGGLAVQMDELPGLMKQAGVDYQQKVYDGCGHAFFNDTNEFAYNKPAAKDAWKSVLSELAKV